MFFQLMEDSPYLRMRTIIQDTVVISPYVPMSPTTIRDEVEAYHNHQYIQDDLLPYRDRGEVNR